MIVCLSYEFALYDLRLPMPNDKKLIYLSLGNLVISGNDIVMRGVTKRWVKKAIVIGEATHLTSQCFTRLMLSVDI